MDVINSIVRGLMLINQWLAQLVLTFMFLSITYFAIARAFGDPVLGSTEITQFSMVLLIVGSLAYSEVTNSHIAIGIVVDRFPEKIQKIFDMIAQVLTFVFCMIVITIFLESMNHSISSDLLYIPFYPFRYAIILGFASWGIVAVYKLFNSVDNIKSN